MKYLLSILLLLGLVGCHTIPQKEKIVTVVEYKYVVVKVPEEALQIPQAPEVPDYQTATDKQIAEFILDQEGFAQKLINIIKGFANYNSGTVDALLKRGIKKEDIIE